jgi:hypothetical protein
MGGGETQGAEEKEKRRGGEAGPVPQQRARGMVQVLPMAPPPKLQGFKYIK